MEGMRVRAAGGSRTGRKGTRSCRPGTTTRTREDPCPSLPMWRSAAFGVVPYGPARGPLTMAGVPVGAVFAPVPDTERAVQDSVLALGVQGGRAGRKVAVRACHVVVEFTDGGVLGAVGAGLVEVFERLHVLDRGAGRPGCSPGAKKPPTLCRGLRQLFPSPGFYGPGRGGAWWNGASEETAPIMHRDAGGVSPATG